ncbi:hypothetical protein FLJC2902T_05030 [Flavobacterium limnosediminis JC2902]|uniref:Uncharacterized protein n=1 Tax=Flavobacterium limnosediminis JC2902 TaxID=1341181 RepID=V6STH5_9FLAO|nr:hypothetical protein FLJC2902T_05030 [Flavobacterium limnosediminis JC2902]
MINCRFSLFSDMPFGLIHKYKKYRLGLRGVCVNLFIIWLKKT